MISSGQIQKLGRQIGVAFEVDFKQLQLSTRGRPEVARARQAWIWIVYQQDTSISWTALGETFKRDRTTVRHAVECIDTRLAFGERSLERKLRGILKSAPVVRAA